MLAVFVGAPRLLGLDGFSVPFVVAFFAILVWNAWRTSLVLRVDVGGVLLVQVDGKHRQQRRVAWPSISEVVLTEGEPSVFFLRTREGNAPADLQVELPNVNRADLTTAVGSFGGGVMLRSS